MSKNNTQLKLGDETYGALKLEEILLRLLENYFGKSNNETTKGI